MSERGREALSSKDTVTLPSVIVKGSKVMVAHADETDDDDEDGRLLEIPWQIDKAVFAGVGMAAIITFGETRGGGHGGGDLPVLSQSVKFLK